MRVHLKFFLLGVPLRIPHSATYGANFEVPYRLLQIYDVLWRILRSQQETNVPDAKLPTWVLVHNLEVGFGLGQLFPVIGQQSISHTVGERMPEKIDTGLLSYCPWDRRIKGLLFIEASAAIPILSFEGLHSQCKSLERNKPSEFLWLGCVHGLSQPLCEGLKWCMHTWVPKRMWLW